MTKGPKITVAGAGALGLTTALALADAGAQVTVFDPAGLGDNASGVAAGMLARAGFRIERAEHPENVLAHYYCTKV